MRAIQRVGGVADDSAVQESIYAGTDERRHLAEPVAGAMALASRYTPRKPDTCRATSRAASGGHMEMMNALRHLGWRRPS